MKTNDASVKRIAQKAYPEYRGRKFYLIPQSYPLDCRSCWDGGSRTYFRFVRLVDMQVSGQVPAQSAFDKPISGLEAVTIPEGFVCVTHSIFCGRDSGLTVYAHPDNLAKLLPANGGNDASLQ